jgi:hypothetical protein
MAAVALTLWLGFATGVANAGVQTISSGYGIASSGYNASWKSGIIRSPTSYLNFSGGTALSNYSLVIAGFKLYPSVSAPDHGDISISPVPEPETYAMMLVGLALLGLSARRRRNNEDT